MSPLALIEADILLGWTGAVAWFCRVYAKQETWQTLASATYTRADSSEKQD